MANFKCPYCEDECSSARFIVPISGYDTGSIYFDEDGDEFDRDYNDTDTDTTGDIEYSCDYCGAELNKERDIIPNIIKEKTEQKETEKEDEKADNNETGKIIGTEKSDEISLPYRSSYQEKLQAEKLSFGIECPECENMFYPGKISSYEELIECTNEECNHLFTLKNIIEKNNANTTSSLSSN